MIRLYLETNFLMSFATGRDTTTIRLFDECPTGIRRLIPSGCRMEALATLEDRRKHHHRQVASYRTEAQEAERNRALPGSAELGSRLRSVISLAEIAFTAFRARLLDAIMTSGDGSSRELIGTRPGRFLGGFQVSEALDPTDQLILATILDDAREHPDVGKVLLTENRRCFHDDRAVRQALADADIRYFPMAEKFLQWYEARAET